MLKHVKDPKEARDTLLALMPTCGTLAGIGVGLAGMIKSGAGGGTTTVADDILLVSALGFLFACYLIFFALRQTRASVTTRMMKLIDVVFLVSLTLIVFSGFVVVYELM